jgi:thiol-disulfide isomerase/thioredoxin
MKFLALTFFVACSFSASAQSNYFLKPGALLKRIENGKDTVFVINFWATWCGPCVKELPNFEQLTKTYAGEKIKVLLVSVDFRSQIEKRVIPFIKKQKYNTEFFVMDEKDQQAYIEKIDDSWSGAIPATLFIKEKKRKFLEKEFSYNELLTEYLNIKGS